MKKKAIILNALTIVSFNLLFWLCNHYPRHIIEISETFSVVANLLNSAYFVLYLFVLNIIFGRNKMLFSSYIFNEFEPITKRYGVCKIAVLLLVQITFDLLKFALGDFLLILAEIVTLLNWIIIYFVLANKNLAVLKNKKSLIITIVAVVLLVGMSALFDADAASQAYYLSQKYEPTSQYLTDSMTNIQFLQEIQNLLFDCAVGVLFVVLHMVNIKNEENKKEKAEPYFIALKSGFAFAIRIAALFLGAYVLLYAKMLIYPVSCLSNITQPSSSSVHYIKDQTFHHSSTGLELYRVTIENGQRVVKISYQNEKHTIFNDNTKIAAVNTIDSNRLYFLDLESDEFTWSASIVKYIGENKVELYRNTALCFIDNGEPTVVKLADLNRYQENELVVGMCKQLLSEGNVYMFEYCADYLLKYDENFIEPYIERYANKNFNSKEKAYISANSYNSDFFVKIANELISQ